MMTENSRDTTISTPKIKVLFLGYAHDQTTLINELIKNNCAVTHLSTKIHTTDGYDLVVCFGYKYIIDKEVINNSDIPIINLHISYLPWNRGAHPNFWSFYDGTPSGVTIHVVDEGLDTGSILYQRLVKFSVKENTFSQTYRKLIDEIEDLFKTNMGEILKKEFKPIRKFMKGTYHRVSDLPNEFRGWGSNIEAEINRLKKIKQIK